MHIRACLMAMVAFFLAAGSAFAASKDVLYGPPADWVIAPPAPTDASSPSGAPARVIYSDTQTLLGVSEDEFYSAQRLKILTPEGLTFGNIIVTWNPSAEAFTIHGLKIIRDGRVIDVLNGSKFQIIQREDKLDYAMLDGKLTATLQVPGLQVGDELEFAVTNRRRDPAFGDRSSAYLQLPVAAEPGVHRLRFMWPEQRIVRWRVTPDLPEPAPVLEGDQHILTYELRDSKSVVTAKGAPPRFNIRRVIEYSGLSDWADISAVLWPLYDDGSTLALDSPIRAEARSIAAATSDPVARTEAALALVQERIRYVYVGLDDGNYRPASAEDTWKRRFGDCKAKTVLLIALLRELGITGEPALVNSHGGDGLDQRQPNPALFDHVVVRAAIAGKTYWLDGTRLGDRRLAVMPPPTFRWALPLRKGPTQLEPVVQEEPALPQFIGVLDVDASAGFDVPAKVSAQRIFRGDGIYQFRTWLSSLSPEDAARAQDAMWRESMSWAEPAKVSWRYDEEQGVVVMTMSGEGKLAWYGEEASGRLLDIFSAGFTPPEPMRRSKEQDQAAPWATDFPTFKCWATTIRLPPDSGRWRWRYESVPVNQRLGGIAYWRRASLEDGVIRTIMSKRTYVPEISAAEAQALNDALPSFPRYMSRVFQTEARGSATTVAARISPAPVDWSSPAVPCSAAADQPSPAQAQSPADLHAVAAPASAASGAPGDDPDTTPPKQDPDHPVTQPPYPPYAMMMREEGAVILNFTVRKDGTVDPETIRIDESSGSSMLDVAAITEAANWRFLPATRKGERVDSPHQFRVVFQLRRLPPVDDFLPEVPDFLQDSYQDTGEAAPDPTRPITQPPYPAAAVVAGQEGDVILQFLVEPDGFVDPNSIVVKKSSGFPLLDKAAVDEAAVNWRFLPATVNGKPVTAMHRFRVVFALKKSEPDE